LRVFCLANGNLQLYLYKQAIVFFASAPFAALDADDDAFDRDLAPHVTNPPRTTIDGNDIRLLHQLEGALITSGALPHQTNLGKKDIDSIMEQIQGSLAEIFKAIEGNPVKFQVN
jgi:tubulin--tyrosine ligase